MYSVLVDAHFYAFFRSKKRKSIKNMPFLRLYFVLNCGSFYKTATTMNGRVARKHYKPSLKQDCFETFVALSGDAIIFVQALQTYNLSFFAP